MRTSCFAVITSLTFQFQCLVTWSHILVVRAEVPKVFTVRFTFHLYEVLIGSIIALFWGGSTGIS